MTSATGKRSFTFIELLFVVILIGVLIGVSLPNLKKAFNNLELNSFSSQLQTFINYLDERAVVEGKIIYLYIDNDQKWCLARFKEEQTTLKKYTIPARIQIGLDNREDKIAFYPDGTIDKVDIELTTADNAAVTLTTKGVYGKARLKAKQ